MKSFDARYLILALAFFAAVPFAARMQGNSSTLISVGGYQLIGAGGEATSTTVAG